AVAQVLRHQHLAEQLQPDEGDTAGILPAVCRPFPEPATERRQARYGDDIAPPHQLPTVVVVGLADLLGDARPVLSPGHRVVAEWAMAVDGQHAGTGPRRPLTRHKQVKRQRRVSFRRQDKLLAAMVLQVDTPFHLCFPPRRWLVLAEEGANRAGKLL